MQIVTPHPKRARIGFIVPQWIAASQPEIQGLPFRSITVASALFDAGYELVWFDQMHDVTLADRTATLREALSGVELTFLWMNELQPAIQFGNVRAIAEQLKAAFPSMRIAVGGAPVMLLQAELLARDPWPVDFFLRDVGEYTAPELARAVHGEGSLDDILGLTTCNGTHLGTRVRARAPIRSRFLSLYRELDLACYVQPQGGIFGNGEDTFTIGTGWGCAKGCRFCYWTTFVPTYLPADEVVDLVSYLRSTYGVKQYHIAELDFFAQRGRPLALAERWRRELPESCWFALVSPIDCLRYDDAAWDLLAAGGCRKLELGTESGSERMLRRIGKRHAPRDPLEITARLLPRGIVTMHNFVFGFVGETRADREASLALIHELHELDRERVFFTFRFFQPAPGTPMGDEAVARTEAFPRSLDELLAYRGVAGLESESSMPWLTPAEERRIKRLVYYYLPMVTSKLTFETTPRRKVYHVLRRLARWRLRHGRHGLGVDGWLYRRLFQSAGLDNTFRA